MLRGKSWLALLDTYEVERRPVAWTRMELTFARPDARAQLSAAFGRVSFAV